MKVVLKNSVPLSFDLCGAEVEVAIRDYVRQKLADRFGNQSWIVSGSFYQSDSLDIVGYSGGIDRPEQPSEITEVEL